MPTLADRIMHARTERLRRAPDWAAATLAGLGAGAVLSLETAVVQLARSRSLWEIPRMTAGILMGPAAGPPPDTFDAAALLVGGGMHAALSIFYGMVVADAVCRLRRKRAVRAGTLVGAAIYAVNFYGFTQLFPGFAQERSLGLFAGHLLFGAAAAGLYKALEKPLSASRPAP